MCVCGAVCVRCVCGKHIRVCAGCVVCVHIRGVAGYVCTSVCVCTHGHHGVHSPVCAQLAQQRALPMHPVERHTPPPSTPSLRGLSSSSNPAAPPASTPPRHTPHTRRPPPAGMSASVPARPSGTRLAAGVSTTLSTNPGRTAGRSSRSSELNPASVSRHISEERRGGGRGGGVAGWGWAGVHVHVQVRAYAGATRGVRKTGSGKCTWHGMAWLVTTHMHLGCLHGRVLDAV